MNLNLYEKTNDIITKINSLNETLTLDIPVYLLEWLPATNGTTVSMKDDTNGWLTLDNIFNLNDVGSDIFAVLRPNIIKISSTLSAISAIIKIGIEDIYIHKVYTKTLGNYSISIDKADATDYCVAISRTAVTNYPWLIMNGITPISNDRLTLTSTDLSTMASPRGFGVVVKNPNGGVRLKNCLGKGYVLHQLQASLYNKFTNMRDGMICLETPALNGSFREYLFEDDTDDYNYHLNFNGLNDMGFYIVQGLFTWAADPPVYNITFKGRTGAALFARCTIKGWDNITKVKEYINSQYKLINNWGN